MSDDWTQPPLPRAEDVSLIMCDVDGTLLTSQHELHPTTVAAIHHIRETRPTLPIVIASGKQLNSCQRLRDQLQLGDFPSIHVHGAVVYGFAEPSPLDGPEPASPSRRELSVVHEHVFDPDVVASLVEAMHELDRAVFLFIREEVILIAKEERAGAQDWLGIARKYDRNVSDASDEQARQETLQKIRNGELKIVKVTVACDLDKVEETRDRLQRFPDDLFTTTRAIPFILELLVPGINKAVALRELCGTLGISTKNVIAFGDGENDAAMLAEAGYGCAMGNAMVGARDAAKYRTVSNDQGGVGVFLNQIFRQHTT